MANRHNGGGTAHHQLATTTTTTAPSCNCSRGAVPVPVSLIRAVPHIGGGQLGLLLLLLLLNQMMIGHYGGLGPGATPLGGHAAS